MFAALTGRSGHGLALHLVAIPAVKAYPLGPYTDRRD